MNLFKWIAARWRAWRSPTESALAVQPIRLSDIEPEAPSLAPDQPPVQRREHKQHDFTYYHLRNDLADAVGQVLDRFGDLHKAENDPTQREVIEELWGCDFLLRDKELGERLKGGDAWGVVDNATTVENIKATWPIEHAFCTVTDEGYVTLTRLTSRTPPEVRGRVRRILPHMLRVVVGYFGETGHWHGYIHHFGLVGDNWVYAGDNDCHDMRATAREHHDKEIKFLLPAVLAARYEWHAAFGLPTGGPRVLVPTNPAGCLQLFRNRDKPEGRTRREALRHWVKEHYRESNDESLAYVCHHLRGNTQFHWSDLDCELLVSAYDLEKNEFFREQAHNWRSARKHNRTKIRRKKTA